MLAALVSLPGSWQRTDEDIAQSASNTLGWNLWVPSNRVKVMVQNGWITLSGDVDWYYVGVGSWRRLLERR